MNKEELKNLKELLNLTYKVLIPNMNMEDLVERILIYSSDSENRYLLGKYKSLCTIEILGFYKIRLLKDNNLITAKEARYIKSLYNEYIKLVTQNAKEALKKIHNSDYVSIQKEFLEKRLEEIRLSLRTYHILDEIDYFEMFDNYFLSQFSNDPVRVKDKEKY